MSIRSNFLPPAVRVTDAGSEFSGNGPTRSPLTARDVEVQGLSESQWRVRDRRLPHADARGLLGFVERIERSESADATFEVMCLSRGFEWFTFASLQEAVAHVVDRSCNASLPAGDLAWIPTEADPYSSESAGSIVDTDYLELEQTQPMERVALMRGIAVAGS